MQPIVSLQRAALAGLCQRMGVKRLEVFGSAARADFDDVHSDIDFLVEFDDTRPDTRGMGTYLGLKEALEQLFARNVDLVEAGTVRNPYVRFAIERDKQLVYAA